MANSEEKLDQLFGAYREACPAPPISANFMPGLWRQIDKRRTLTWKLKIYSRGLVTAALALCMTMFALQWAPVQVTASPVYSKTYLEALEDDNPVELLAYTEGPAMLQQQ